ncbi:MAG: hypothetical protein ABR976_16690 [Terracidiphilus sp.]
MAFWRGTGLIRRVGRIGLDDGLQLVGGVIGVADHVAGLVGDAGQVAGQDRCE